MVVRSVEEWSVKHAVRVDDFLRRAKVQREPCLGLEPHACACDRAVK